MVINKLLCVTGLVSFILDYYSDIQLTINFHKNCIYDLVFYSVIVIVIWSFILQWVQIVMFSYFESSKENSTEETVSSRKSEGSKNE